MQVGAQVNNKLPRILLADFLDPWVNGWKEPLLIRARQLLFESLLCLTFPVLLEYMHMNVEEASRRLHER